MGRIEGVNMRYEPDDGNQRKRKPAKDNKPRFIEVDVEIRSKPRDECIIRNGKIEHQVVATGLVFNGNSADGYIIRFTHKNEVKLARKLQAGQKIRVQKGRYEYRHGRSGAEFHVRKSSLRAEFELHRSLKEKLQTQVVALRIRIASTIWAIQLN
jgi:hypothetical protein